MNELVFIKLFLDREIYIKFRSYIPNNLLDNDLVELMQIVDNWYRDHGSGNPTLKDLYLLMLPKGDKEKLKFLFQTLHNLEIPDSASEALKEFKKKQLFIDIANAAVNASEGKYQGEESITGLVDQLNQTNNHTDEDEEELFRTPKFADLLSKTDRSKGLKWRLKVLQDYLGNLLPGDFGFFVARPETGKTTLLASEATHLALQTSSDRPVIWFNNEEPHERVYVRVIQAFFAITYEEFASKPEYYEDRYTKEMDNRLILLSDNFTYQRIEYILTKKKPSVIILDQIDPILGFKNDRDDLRLGAIYKWARNIAKFNSCAVIGCCQADVTGEGQAWLYMSNVANAKTEKQATGDFIVGVGKKHDLAFANIRFIHMMKNKLSGHHSRHQVLIKADIARYEDC